MSGASVVAYILGEGLADAAAAKGDYYEGDVYIGGENEEEKEDSEIPEE